MSERKTFPLVFDCYKCGQESRYDHYLEENKQNSSPAVVIKRCLNCSAENQITLPTGYGANPNNPSHTSVLRGGNVH